MEQNNLRFLILPMYQSFQLCIYFLNFIILRKDQALHFPFEACKFE